MATREEIISGMNLLIQEGQRAGKDLTAEDWARAEDLDGWKNKEIMAHVAGVATLVPGMVSGLSNAPEGTNAGAGIDIDQLNAALVNARKEKSIPELVDEMASAYEKVIDLVKEAPDELLNKKVTFAGYRDVPVSDIMVRMVVLHGLAHIYSAYATVMNSGR